MPAKEQPTPTEPKSAKRSWTSEEKELVWNEVSKAKQDGRPLTEAFRHITTLLPHRSEAGAAMLYYNVLRKQEQPETKSASGETQEANVLETGTPLAEALQGLPEYLSELTSRVESLEQKVRQPEPRAVGQALHQLLARLIQEQTDQSRTQHIEQELAELKQANQALQQQLCHLRQTHAETVNLYDMFTNMASISQIVSLGDFKEQLKQNLDQWTEWIDPKTSPPAEDGL